MARRSPRGGAAETPGASGPGRSGWTLAYGAEAKAAGSTLKAPIMVSHIVLMSLRADLSAADRQALTTAFERAVRDIPSVRSVRLGSRLLQASAYEAGAPRDGDYLIVVDFDDIEGLQMYLEHPAHKELGIRFNQAIRSALIYDFEVGGIETLSRLRELAT